MPKTTKQNYDEQQDREDEQALAAEAAKRTDAIRKLEAMLEFFVHGLENPDDEELLGYPIIQHLIKLLTLYAFDLNRLLNSLLECITDIESGEEAALRDLPKGDSRKYANLDEQIGVAIVYDGEEYKLELTLPEKPREFLGLQFSESVVPGRTIYLTKDDFVDSLENKRQKQAESAITSLQALMAEILAQFDADPRTLDPKATLKEALQDKVSEQELKDIILFVQEMLVSPEVLRELMALEDGDKLIFKKKLTATDLVLPRSIAIIRNGPLLQLEIQCKNKLAGGEKSTTPQRFKGSNKLGKIAVVITGVNSYEEYIDFRVLPAAVTNEKFIPRLLKKLGIARYFISTKTYHKVRVNPITGALQSISYSRDGEMHPIDFLSVSIKKEECDLHTVIYDARKGLLTLSMAEKLDILCQIATILQHFHEQGLVFQDLKLENICLTKIAGKWQVVLIDPGMVAKHGDNFALASSTIHYAAPEILASQSQHLNNRSKEGAWKAEYFVNNMKPGSFDFIGKYLYKARYESDEAPKLKKEACTPDTQHDMYALGIIMLELLLETRATPVTATIEDFHKFMSDNEDSHPELAELVEKLITNRAGARPDIAATLAILQTTAGAEPEQTETAAAAEGSPLNLRQRMRAARKTVQEGVSALRGRRGTGRRGRGAKPGGIRRKLSFGSPPPDTDTSSQAPDTARAKNKSLF